MLRRVIIGGSPFARRLARGLRDAPGELTVLVEDDDAAERLREDSIAAATIDLEDAAALRSATHGPAVVIVVSETPKLDSGRLTAAKAAFGDAWLVAVSPDSWPDAGTVADQRIVTERTGAATIAAELQDPGFRRSVELVHTMSRLEGPVAVVMHDNPDPDAIAAAFGLVHIAESVGHEAQPLYAGEITHQENRAFVNVLELELHTYEIPFDPEQWGSIALVDHAHPGVNDQLDPTTEVDIIIDHHPSREEAEAMFVDRRHGVGATSTLVAEHLLRTQVDPDDRLASALWYGIQVDTDGFRRGVSELDFEVAARLRLRVDAELLEQIEAPQMTAGTLETIGMAIDNRSVYDDILIADTGELHDRDALAQAADRLLQMAGITTVLVYGRRDEMLYASARSRNDSVDVGEAIRLAFGQIGNAGGHEDMAGAQIPIGVLAPDPLEEDSTAAGEVIVNRFLEGVEVVTRPLPSGYHEDAEGIE